MKRILILLIILMPNVALAQSTTVTSTTCGGTDKVSAITSTGAVTCSADQGSSGPLRYDEIVDAGTNAGLIFSAFTNSWTSTATTGDFFDITASSLTAGDAATINVGTSTTGDALEINRGATKVAGIDGFGQLSVGSFGGTMNGNSGINFSTFSNLWTGTTNIDFFTAFVGSVAINNAFTFSATGIDTGTALSILVGSGVTSGKAFEVMAGASSTFPVFVADDINVGLGRSATNEAQFEVFTPGAFVSEGMELSDADVVHTFTSLADSDVYCDFQPVTDSIGGVAFRGFTDNDTEAMVIRGHVGSTAPTVAAVQIEGYKNSGTTRVGIGTTENLMGIRSGTSTVIHFFGSGKMGIRTTGPIVELDVAGQVKAESWGGTSTTNSGISFGGFTNSWTSTLAGAFFDILGADNSTIMTLKINATQANVTAADTFIDFRSTDGSEGSVAGTAVAGVIAYNTFTGSHYTWVDEREGLEPGILLEATGELMEVPNQVLSKAKVSSIRKSQAAYGIWGGMNKDNFDMVLSIGSGVIWVTNKGEDLEVGDYLMSSDVRGHAEKQDDDIYYQYTVAKVMEPVQWRPGEKRRKVACILLGG